MSYNLDLNEVGKMSQNRDFPKVSKILNKFFFVHSIKMQLQKAIVKIRGIKGYKSLSEDEILGALTSSKPVKKGEKPKTDFSKARIEKIRK